MRVRRSVPIHYKVSPVSRRNAALAPNFPRTDLLKAIPAPPERFDAPAAIGEHGYSKDWCPTLGNLSERPIEMLRQMQLFKSQQSTQRFPAIHAAI